MRAGIIRYASACKAIAAAIGGETTPQCSILAGRVMVLFRGLRADLWTEPQRVEHASRVARVAREVLARDERRDVRARATRAIAVQYDDRFVARGASGRSVWELVVPDDSQDGKR